MKQIILYGLSFLIILAIILYNARPEITVDPLHMELRSPAALLYAPVSVVIWLLIGRVYLIGFKQGRKEGLKDCEEINKIGREAEKR
jgi:hypothetical protein